MAICLEFIESEKVIYLTTSEPITLADMEQVADESRRIHERSSRPIHTILDASQIKAIPQGALRGRTRPEFTHSMAGGIVIVGANLLVRTITSVVAKLAHSESITYCETIEEAWACVRARNGEVYPLEMTGRAQPPRMPSGNCPAPP